MDSEPTINPREKTPNQELLKGIFDAIGILSQDGEEAIAQRIRKKNFTPPIVANWDNLTDIFVAQLTEKGKRESSGVQDRNVVLSFKNQEPESIDYRLYKENDSYRIEKEENFKKQGRKPPENWFEALEGAAKVQHARDLEKELGYTKVDASETQRLSDLLNELVKQKKTS